METFKLVSLQWISEERDKYIWEDLYCKPWDEIIGRVYLLKAHCEREKAEYAKALPAFEQALALLAGHGDQEYYYRALADKAACPVHA